MAQFLFKNLYLNLMQKIQFCHFSYHEGWCAAEMSTTAQKPGCGWMVVSPGIGLPGTTRRRSTACLQSWWAYLGWLASLSVSSLCWTALTCWPHPASSYGSPVQSQTSNESCGLNQAITAIQKRLWKIQALHDNIVIIYTNSSDFGRRWVHNTLPDASLRQKFLMARQPGYECWSTDTPW